MKETRAVVLGIIVVVLVATGIAVWRRPARELRNVKSYRVEVQKTEGDSRRRLSFNVPVSLVARIASLAPIREIGGDIRADWGHGEVSPQDILEAADKSEPGKPGVLERDGNRIEVTSEGSALHILVKDDWGKEVRIRLPRVLVETVNERRNLSVKDILRRLDELGPGEVVEIRDSDGQVTITAQPR